MDRLTEMEAFATVIDEGSFTRAAKRLGVSKSAVSKYVSALEDRLGAQLLRRTTRRVTPTEIGLAYYDRARRVLRFATEAEAVVHGVSAAPSGVLHVSAPADFGATQVAPLFAEFMTDAPEVRLNLTLRGPGEKMRVDEHDLIIGIGDPPSQDRHATILAETCYRVIAAPRYLAWAGAPVTPSDLGVHRCLGAQPPEGSPVWKIPLSDQRTQEIRHSKWSSITDARAVMAAVASGAGVGYLPSYLFAGAMQRGDVVDLFPDLPLKTVPIYIDHAPGLHLLPKVKAFVGFLQDKYQGSERLDWQGVPEGARGD